jgi:hypothetical protein
MLLPERVRAFVQDNHKMQAAAGNCCSNKPFDFKGEITSQSPEWICAHIIASNQTSVDFSDVADPRRFREHHRLPASRWNRSATADIDRQLTRESIQTRTPLGG